MGVNINLNNAVTCMTKEEFDAMNGYTNANTVLLVSIATIILGIIIFLVIRKIKKKINNPERRN